MVVQVITKYEFSEQKLNIVEGNDSERVVGTQWKEDNRHSRYKNTRLSRNAKLYS